jgi:hypothetical protein
MRRNAPRFPEDFAFRVSRKEFDNIRSQIVTASKNRPMMWSQIVTTSQKYRRADSLPIAFTERQQRHARTQDREFGEEIRRKIRCRLCRDQTIDSAARTRQETRRI